MMNKTLPNIELAFRIYHNHRKVISPQMLEEMKRRANITEWQLLNALKQIDHLTASGAERLEQLKAERAEQKR